MADAINPRGQNPIHVGFKQGSDGTAKLVVSSGKVRKEVDCKVVETGFLSKVQSVFFHMTNWVLVEHEDLQNKKVQIFVRQSDLETLQREGLDIGSGIDANKATAYNLPPNVSATVEAFFQSDVEIEEMREAHFLARLQTFLATGGKQLNLEGMFNSEGKCPNVFDDPMFERMEELSLQGIREVPSSIKHLKNLKGLDLSHSPIVNCPRGIGELTSLEYLNLAFSGINQVSALTRFGKEFCGGARSDATYLEEGSKQLVHDWFQQLKKLKHLKVVNMASEDRANCDSASRLSEAYRAEGLKITIHSMDNPNWKN